LEHNDGLKLFKDGVEMYSETNPRTVPIAVFLGDLDNNSIVEIRFTDIASAGLMQVQFTTVAPGLPVRLISFTAEKDKTKSRLQWKTTDEINNKGFFVLRSADGQHYSSIGWVAAQTNAASVKNYSFVDDQPLPGMNYYQLRQVDLDGREELSPVRSVFYGQESVVSLAPNPAGKMVTITGAAGAIMLINDISGRLIRSVKISSQSERVNTGDLKAGLYLVTVIDKSGNKQTMRLLKAN
jgi:hypothetical protein